MRGWSRLNKEAGQVNEVWRVTKQSETETKISYVHITCMHNAPALQGVVPSVFASPALERQTSPPDRAADWVEDWLGLSVAAAAEP